MATARVVPSLFFLRIVGVVNRSFVQILGARAACCVSSYEVLEAVSFMDR